jgi:hypothetical protein
MYRIYGRLLRTRPGTRVLVHIRGMSMAETAALKRRPHHSPADGDYGAEFMKRRVRDCGLSRTVGR